MDTGHKECNLLCSSDVGEGRTQTGHEGCPLASWKTKREAVQCTMKEISYLQTQQARVENHRALSTKLQSYEGPLDLTTGVHWLVDSCGSCGRRDEHSVSLLQSQYGRQIQQPNIHFLWKMWASFIQKLLKQHCSPHTTALTSAIHRHKGVYLTMLTNAGSLPPHGGRPLTLKLDILVGIQTVQFWAWVNYFPYRLGGEVPVKALPCCQQPNYLSIQRQIKSKPQMKS